MRQRVAVIGGGLGGLTAAGELARAGKQVTLFEAGATLGGKAQTVRFDSIILDTGPTLLAMPHVVAAQFERLGAMDLMPRTQRLELHARYAYADGRVFDCWDELSLACDSAERLAAGEGLALRRFYAEAEAVWRAAGEPYLEAPVEGLGDFSLRLMRRGLKPFLTGLHLGTLDSFAARFFATSHLRQFAGRYATYAGASPYRASGAFAQIAHLERAFGVHHIEGGMGQLVAALTVAVHRLGVEVRLGQPSRYFERRGELLAGPSGDERAFDAVIVNADPLAALGRASEPLSLSGYVFHVAVDRRLHPLPHHLLVFAEDARAEFEALFSGQLPDAPTIYVNHAAASDRSMAPSDKSGLYVMINTPAFSPSRPLDEVEAEWAERGARLEEASLRRLEEHIPGLRGAPRTVFARRSPVDLARATGALGGSIYGFLPHGPLGPFRRPKLRAPTPGVFFAGGGTYPGGGVFMVMLSGRFAAGLAQHHLQEAA